MTCKAPGLYFLPFTPLSVGLPMCYLCSIWILNLGHLLPICNFDHLVSHPHHQLMNRYTNCYIILLPMEYYSVIEINEVLRVLQHRWPLKTCWKKPDMIVTHWKVPFTRNVQTRQIQRERRQICGQQELEEWGWGVSASWTDFFWVGVALRKMFLNKW